MCIYKATRYRKLTCLKCDIGYYLNSDGKCVSFTYMLDIIPNCLIHDFDIGGSIFSFDINDKDVYLKNSNFEYDFEEINKALKNNKNKIKTTCQFCQKNYFLNNNGKCQIMTVEKCNGRFLITNSNITEEMSGCLFLCYEKGYPFIYLGLINNNIDNNIIDISDYSEIKFVKDLLKDINNDYHSETFYKYTEETKNYILDSQICYQISDDTLKSKFKGCYGVIFTPSINSYQCIKCKRGYILDNNAHICRKIYNDDILSNISTIYDYYGDNYYNESNEQIYIDPYYGVGKTLVTFENGQKG